MNSINNRPVAEVFNQYPDPVREKMMALRQLVLDTAAELDEVGKLEETLKWGEPSYLTKTGSTIRLDWKSSSPHQYALYFNCKTKLVDTFKELYGMHLRFDGNRALILELDEDIPVDKVKHCLSLALTYHLRKHLPMLGV